MQGLAKCILLLVAISASARNVQKVTPVEKVISLLTRLSKEVAADGKLEAEQYDKYACFCKEQADEKLYNIEKSDALLEKLTAEIKKLDGEIKQLGLDIAAKLGDVKQAVSDTETETKSRADDHAGYRIDDKKNVNAIDAVKRAIKALKESKGGLKGDSDLDLMQIKALVEQLEPGTAHAFKYSSNDIITTLNGLLSKFKAKKKGRDQQEFDEKSLSDKLLMGYEIARREAQKEADEKQALKDEKSATKTAKEAQRTQETNDRDADQAFLDHLTEKCETKATNWDQRSQKRSEELTALSEAIEHMRDSEAKFGANERLNLKQKSSKVTKAKAISLLQVSAHSSTSMESLLQQTLSLLDTEAKKQHSSILAEIVLKMRTADDPSTKDHFAKVRGMIKSLVARLKQQALDEAATKSECDKDMAQQTTDRDSARMEIEKEEALQARLNQENSDLSDEKQDNLRVISETTKALAEATTLRKEEKEANEATIKDAGDGKTATENARTVLKDFYGFLQKKASFEPAPGDRAGNTVKDLEPESWEGEYDGKGTEAGGIIAMIDVIISDFERTVKTTQDQEDADEKEFQSFKKESEDEIDAKEKRNGVIDGDISKNKQSILTSQGTVKIQTEKLDGALEQLKILKEKCVDGEETWEERAAARKKEIEALKEARRILESWDA